MHAVWARLTYDWEGHDRLVERAYHTHPATFTLGSLVEPRRRAFFELSARSLGQDSESLESRGLSEPGVQAYEPVVNGAPICPDVRGTQLKRVRRP